ncbi:AMP-binding protein [Seonamhaeicola sp.]|uniref:AMP-binding protein n=1 Tax=Seonamhaeicola sp. TaxID=1912245 RepID=UPI0026033A3B|nr:AMP-binding protein [Seonamhaeicola sp.]
MNPSYNKVHNRFKLNGIYYSYEDLMEVAYSYVKEGEPYQRDIGSFLLDWLDQHDTITVKTSGSTGTAKLIKVKKQSMVNSAIATGDFFHLKPGDKALHCLPTTYIAGRMMLVRAIMLGLEIDLIEPASKPVFNTNKAYDFCAMVPMQLKNAIEDCSNIKTIIVGGAAVSGALLKQIEKSPCKVYATYGMTETVTHIALKKLNNIGRPHDLYFKILPNIEISQDERACLVIDAPYLANEKVVTNDIVKLYSKTEFQWLGRFDNMINSGGVKVFPEQIEKKLRSTIDRRFFIASEPDETLGDKVVLVLEGDSDPLDNSAFDNLDKYEKPKAVYTVKAFVETGSGKIQRKETLELLNN